MKSSSPFVLYTLCLFTVLGGLAMSFFMIDSTSEYTEQKSSANNILGLSTRMENIVSEFSSDRAETMEMYDYAYYRLNEAEKQYSNAANYAWLTAGCMLLLLATVFSVYHGGPMFYKALTLMLLSTSLVCLVLGVFTPMMEIDAYLEDFGARDIPLIGDFILYGKTHAFYQNKSIATVIGLLWSAGSYFVAAIIFLLSVLTPLMKLVLTLILVFSESMRKDKAMNWIVANIGKWSNADVFTAGIFLAFLAFNNLSTGVELESKTLMGTYFFSFFVILSVISSMTLKEFQKREANG